MKKYNHKEIEDKWQKKWDESGIYKAEDNSKKEKYYLLVEFPYPSGEGLHVGHVRSYTALDIIARKRRAEGHNVLYPIGWDAFGLPTENYAVKTGIHPETVTKDNTDNFRRQLKELGFSFDWSREINTTDPSYYKWTQWIFLQLYKKGLAYKKKMPINWCLSCKTGLANEEVVDGVCERCGGEIEKREKEQWMLAITKYADRLDSDIDTVDYLDRIKTQQRNWIGKSKGHNFSFLLDGSNEKIDVFTTRIDTLFGATYMVLSPEHPLIHKLEEKIENITDVKEYISKTAEKTEIERLDEGKKKTGVELNGIKAINPVNQEKIPVFIADYVLPHYGTGAIMAVPAHDVRDYEFAKQFGLPVKKVIRDKSNKARGTGAIIRTANGTFLFQRRTKDASFRPGAIAPFGGGREKNEKILTCLKRELDEELSLDINDHLFTYIDDVESHYWKKEYISMFTVDGVAKDRLKLTEGDNIVEMTFDEAIKSKEVTDFTKEVLHKLNVLNESNIFLSTGELIDSDNFDGIDSEEGKEKIANLVNAKEVTTYKLRDWIFSRQRYWGEPIPMIHCEKCGWVPVAEKDLPVELPKVEKYQPTESGESPLSSVKEWVNTKCPECGGEGKRETDTMPNWAGSSWYYLRYSDPQNETVLASKEALEYWTPVDWYNGGMEHTTLHLLYSRFWHKFLFDIGVAPTPEPYLKRTSHGFILAEGGVKMSKSKGNVINPSDVSKKVGADTLRVYEMFTGPFDQSFVWSTDNMVGVHRFLERTWRVSESIGSDVLSKTLLPLLHKTIKKVGEDIEALKFNTAISQLMILLNKFESLDTVPKDTYRIFVKLLSPFAPHISEELWEALGEEASVHLEKWPVYDADFLLEEETTIVVQVNGKVRGEVVVHIDTVEEEVKEKALQLPIIIKWLEGKTVEKVIYVPHRVLNLVVK